MLKALIDKLEKEHILSPAEFAALIEESTRSDRDYLFEKARKIKESYFGNKIYIRGLIEFTNYCKNDCLYCGIRRSNKNAERYRLSKDEILSCCETGYSLGFRTFVLQGGEDPYFNDERMTDIVSSIKERYGDCALTLSLGERSYESYKALFEAGADRYLLRHETADSEHYAKLHPEEMLLSSRKQALYDLKEIGFQVGTGFMVGSPYQTTESLCKDLEFLYEFKPHMVGIGPFIPHHDTPFKDFDAGSVDLTLLLIGIIRLILPAALIPATTALGTLSSRGREFGVLSGANVVMPNLSPTNVRDKYLLYDNKICTGDEAAECRYCMERRMNSIGSVIAVDRGDSPLLAGSL